MPNSSRRKKTYNTSLKKHKQSNTTDKQPKPKNKKTNIQKAGAEAGAESSDICQKDINQLLMGNPPSSIGASDVDVKAVWKDTKRTAKDLDSYTKKGWGNYPGTPPKPDCVIL
jgi:hypothetical protein